MALCSFRGEGLIFSLDLGPGMRKVFFPWFLGVVSSSLWYKEGTACTIETCNMHNRPRQFAEVQTMAFCTIFLVQKWAFSRIVHVGTLLV